MPSTQTNAGFYVVLIPAYKPDERLLTLCQALRTAQLAVLVVDDGSGVSFAPLFTQVVVQGVPVVRHAVNLGKGRALKTGINEALQRYPHLAGLITADADGQHTPTDILRIIDAMRAHPDALVTGARTFAGAVPFRSRAGNIITRNVYHFVTGIRCQDTQTGLRGIPACALASMIKLSGEGYEFEMTMLLKLRDLRLPLFEVPIETIYIDENKGSHFHPLRDTLRIYSVILRFLASSLLSFGLDYLLYLVMLHATQSQPWISYAVARILSSAFNYSLNKLAVFGGRGGKGAIFRYYLLASAQLLIGAGLVQLLGGRFGLNASLIKIPVDIVLFFLSYILQRDFVFGERKRTTSS